MLNLKEFVQRKYRVTVDPSFEFTGVKDDRLWYYQIPGRHGHVYVHGIETLGVYVTGRLKINMVGAIPGLKLHQKGDTEATYIFAPELLDVVATEIKARKRRRLTEAQRAVLVERGTKALADFHKLRNEAPAS